MPGKVVHSQISMISQEEYNHYSTKIWNNVSQAPVVEAKEVEANWGVVKEDA
jgi:hypothetical protein